MSEHATNIPNASAARSIPVWAQHLIVFVVFISIWELAVRNEWVSRLILPSPFDVVFAWWDLAIVKALIWKHFFVTLTEVVVGFLLGAGFGLTIAILSAMNKTFRRLISPYMVALQVTPRIAVAPIIVAWLGFNMEPKIAIAAIICFFPIFINSLTGLMRLMTSGWRCSSRCAPRAGRSFATCNCPVRCRSLWQVSRPAFRWP